MGEDIRVIGMLPARLHSSRLPEKALVDIEGLPMFVHTCKRAQLAESLDDVYLATDSEKIKEIAETYNIKVIMTGTHHKTGSDRLAEACQGVDCEIVVNVQADEPLVKPEHIDAIVKPLLEDRELQISVGVTPYKNKENDSDIKAVLDLEDNIMYCSRNDLPSDVRTTVDVMLKMCFIVPFRKKFLIQFASWPSTPLENIEYNEYLRVLEHGVKLRGVIIEDAKISVDTPDDLEGVRRLMKSDDLKAKYS
jgi:3-deoxy-manno-octulosonate cytidylyltransferase (CMP-KDO synthetase)